MLTAGDGELALRAPSYYAARAARSLPITLLALRARLPCADRAARSRLAALALLARIQNYCSTQEISNWQREGRFKGVRDVSTLVRTSIGFCA